MGVIPSAQPDTDNQFSTMPKTKRFTRGGGSVTLGTKAPGANDTTIRAIGNNPMRKNKRRK